jgi:hypothetical protein
MLRAGCGWSSPKGHRKVGDPNDLPVVKRGELCGLKQIMGLWGVKAKRGRIAYFVRGEIVAVMGMTFWDFWSRGAGFRLWFPLGLGHEAKVEECWKFGESDTLWLSGVGDDFFGGG